MSCIGWKLLLAGFYLPLAVLNLWRWHYFTQIIACFILDRNSFFFYWPQWQGFGVGGYRTSANALVLFLKPSGIRWLMDFFGLTERDFFVFCFLWKDLISICHVLQWSGPVCMSTSTLLSAPWRNNLRFSPTLSAAPARTLTAVQLLSGQSISTPFLTMKWLMFWRTLLTLNTVTLNLQSLNPKSLLWNQRKALKKPSLLKKVDPNLKKPLPRRLAKLSNAKIKAFILVASYQVCPPSPKGFWNLHP